MKFVNGLVVNEANSLHYLAHLCSELFRKCDYCDTLNHSCFKNKNSENLFLIYFKICSLQKHIDEQTNHLSGFKNQPQIIAVSKTKLREGNLNRNIDLEQCFLTFESTIRTCLFCKNFIRTNKYCVYVPLVTFAATIVNAAFSYSKYNNNGRVRHRNNNKLVILFNYSTST